MTLPHSFAQACTDFNKMMVALTNASPQLRERDPLRWRWLGRRLETARRRVVERAAASPDSESVLRWHQISAATLLKASIWSQDAQAGHELTRFDKGV